jgi:signal transduction histidine kinase
LAVAKLNVELLKSTQAIESKDLVKINRILKNTNAAIELVQKYRSYEDLKEGSYQLRPVILSFDHFIEPLSNKNLLIINQVKSNGFVEQDEYLVTMLLNEIISNAIQHSPLDSIPQMEIKSSHNQFTMTLLNLTNDRSDIRITLLDTIQGIDNAQNSIGFKIIERICTYTAMSVTMDKVDDQVITVLTMPIYHSDNNSI